MKVQSLTPTANVVAGLVTCCGGCGLGTVLVTGVGDDATCTLDEAFAPPEIMGNAQNVNKANSASAVTLVANRRRRRRRRARDSANLVMGGGYLI
ncbi:MAG: hypothetical protein HKL85_08370 [Acidimicrobiaceae bacterium]|nr:hypothetical protein [Acidimicrobiaceae bacterium]